MIKCQNRPDWLKLRTHYICSTDLPALFGLTPYKNSPTIEQLWHEKKNHIVNDFENSRAMEWGKRFEEPTARGLAEERGWTIEDRRDCFYVDEERGLATTTDFEVVAPIPGIFEIKLVNEFFWRSKWVGGSRGFQAPFHVELQVQHQLLVRQMTRAYIGVNVGLCRGMVDVRFPNVVIQREIVRRSAAFRKSLLGDIPLRSPRQPEAVGTSTGYPPMENYARGTNA